MIAGLLVKGASLLIDRLYKETVSYAKKQHPVPNNYDSCAASM